MGHPPFRFVDASTRTGRYPVGPDPYNRRVKSPDGYDDVYSHSLRDPEAFWADAAEAVSWHERWTTVLDRRNPPFYRWFAGGMLNICYSAVDRHADGPRADQLALIYDSPVTGVIRRFTYRELRDGVARVAGALRSLGVSKGDRVLIFMPNTPEAVMTMLASARLGAVHSVVFGGFASRELATRIDDARPKVIVWASCGIEPGRVIPYKPLLDGALKLASHEPEGCLVLQRPMMEAVLEPRRDVEWTAALEAAEPVRECVPVLATDPLYILYTSGTTGKPKGVVHDNGGYAVALAWSMPHIYGAAPGDVYWAASDIGWAVGHSYIVYGPLLHGCTTVLYEGKPVGTPDAGAFWRVISQHGVNILFTAPTAFRAIKRADPNGEFIGKHDLSSFRTLFLAGERSDTDTIQWAERRLGVPVLDHWWQTETGWAICANPAGLTRQPVKYGSTTKPMPGYSVKVVDAHGREVEKREIGNIVIELPLPPGCLPTLWNNDDGFVASYLTAFPGSYQTADAGYEDEDGYFWIMTRTDDVINVAGHRLSTGEMEEVLAAHADVAECAVVGVRDALKGQVPFGFIVLKNGVTRDPSDVIRDVVAMVRDRIGPVAAFKQAAIVDRLPKTRSGKVLRGTMRSIADGQPYAVPATIDDPAILDEIRDALQLLGYGRT
jgi:propionyl-CoA synthetase